MCAMHRFRGMADRFRRDRRATSAIEFALVLPFLLALYFGAYDISQEVSAYRKMTITTHTVADLTTQYSSVTSNDVSGILNASAQVMAPFSTANLSIVVTEFQVSQSGVATVTWSQALNGTALTTGKVYVLPANICLAGASIVLSNVTYNFTPPVGYKLTGAISMSDHLYMSPRKAQSISYTAS